jgi:GT2 family glycosyltransferase
MRTLTLIFVSLLPALTLSLDDAHSEFSRGMAAQGARMTLPEKPTVERARYPETNPQICLAFLSCCGRTDLLNHTLAAAIRHMEEDEVNLRYEIAWVDNGSGEENTFRIEDSYQMEHALVLPQNAGLAYGMNLLIFNVCQAPYILLLEEDWLYLDYLVATQTTERKRAISMAIALLEQQQQEAHLTSFDGRQVMGVFLRPETYGTFLQPPFVHEWVHTTVNLDDSSSTPECIANNNNNDDDNACPDRSTTTTTTMTTTTSLNYQIYCADVSFASRYIWGSYTNGAGLYSRTVLRDIGRMYGEPGDVFHDRYVEVNYAYRAGLRYCHAAIQLGECRDISNPECTAAFYHIGGGRGTRPRTKEGSKCIDDGWTFYGTPFYEKYISTMQIGRRQAAPICNKEDLEEMRHLRAKDADSAEYREEVRQQNLQVFEMEEKKRNEMREQAHLLRTMDKELLRKSVDWLADNTDEEINALADKMEAFANSAHPLKGFWDSHGRALV